MLEIDRAILFGLAASIGMLVFVLELVRQRRLREEYSLLWLATALVLILLSISRPLLDVLAGLVGIYYPPSALFVVALVFILLMLLHFSTVLTRLAQENKDTAQQLALLRWELEQAQQALAARPPHAEQQQNDQPGSVSEDHA
ncbi:MAG: DUF2304 domain-containing protein [Anaerolineaceae bacterium]|nr:DUF2304 domain-containing protein [Anaerolineaceae bacterium]